MNFKINNIEIGKQCPPYVIAEVSANHNGDINKALATITAAKASGAHAAKIQTYTADTMTIDCDTDDFMIKSGPWSGYKLYDLYKWAETPFEWHQKLFEHARNIGITIFSTPFDETAVDLLEEFNVPAYKIASFELIDLPLIKYVANKKKPMIISTGMANKEEIGEALEAARLAGCNDLIILHCISSYPAPIDQASLVQIKELAKDFSVNVGLSDHTLGTTAAIGSIAMGACMIEKHFTLDRSDKGPDSAFSIEPHELKTLCESVKDCWLAIGQADYDLRPSEENSLIFRRSLYFVKDVQKGAIIQSSDVARIRPGYGLAPKHYHDIVGRRARESFTRGTPVNWECLVD